MRFREKGRNEGGNNTTHATTPSLTHTNYFKQKKNVVANENVNKMSRNKSIIRSSSTGSYPYPRTHTTLMVIPSNRPPPSPSSSNKPPNKLFTGVRRRPPLNRACPPIPESKSNESIMSHASRISEKKVQTPQPIEDLIIENRNVVDVLDSNSNQIRHPSSTTKKMSSTPRSPLMSVAHSVKNKLTRITNIGRSSQTTTTSGSSKKTTIKTSQSFSGIRQPKTTAKRIDQNANRVIKSSSMDVSQPSTSKVSIPQDPTPLNHDKIEEISESGLVPKSEIAEVVTPPREQFCVKLEEDVLVVTRQFDEQYPGQKRSASPDAMLDNNGNPSSVDEVTEQKLEIVETIEKVVETEKIEDIVEEKEEGGEDKEVEVEVEDSSRRDVIVQQLLEKREASPEKLTMFQEPPTKFVLTVKTPEALRRHHTFTIADKEKAELRISKSKSDCDVKPKKLVKQQSEPERFVSPERYVMVVKTPEALRKHRTLTIGVKQQPDVDVENLEKVVKLKRDPSKEKPIEMEVAPPTKYVMVMKTPEALRKHRTLTIGQRAQSLEEEENRVRQAVNQKRDTSEPPRITKFLMSIKTPEALRKHRTLTIGQRTQSLDEEVVKTRNLEKVARLKRDTSVEKTAPQESPSTKYVIMMKTPESLRRHHTFTIGDRPRSPDYPYIEEGELTEPIATVGPPAERRRRQENKERKKREWEEYDRPPAEKFILTTSMTPNTMRRYQTFVVEPKKAAAAGLVTSMSAEPVVKRSESTTKNSYLKRLQFELFRGRSRERKCETNKRQKSLDERKPESAQKYILSTTTPVMMRKYQTFSIVNKKSEKDEDEEDEKTDNKNIESIAASYQSPVNFYSITATTPVTSRKQFVEPDPEPRHLFVIGGGSNGRRSPRDVSNSDMAERKSTASGDLTSPEEEIPMDTNLTPTTEEEPIVTRRIDLMMNSPIEEEPESLALSKSEVSMSVPVSAAPPVFTAPSPPPVQLVPKSTSTSSSSSGSSSSSRKPTQLPIMVSNITPNPMHIVELRPETKQHQQSKKSKIASKSLRNAGKMLTPSFLRKDRKSDKKVHGYVKTTTTGRQHVSERVAPLAEGESSVVANSPLVENLPITFEKWSEKSPRLGSKRFSETIVEEGLDANANSVLETQIQLQNQNSSVPAHDTGLIDDDIMDQPMLVGDTFSHSSSIDCISTSQLPQPTSNFISESIISIDRSSIMHETTRNTPNRQQNEAAYNRSPNLNLTRQIDAGLCEVEDIKSQLQRLNKLVNEMGVSNWEDEIIRLRRENEQLRRELAQRDATIAALQSQTASA